MATVFVAWPLLFLIFLGLAGSSDIIIRFERTIVVAAIIASLMGLFLVAGAFLGYLGEVESLLHSQGAVVGLYRGHIEYRLFNMTTLIYALPFLLTLSLIDESEAKNNGMWRGLVWIALMLSVVACLVSGRRVFWLLAISSPIFVLVLFILSGRYREVRRVILAMIPIPLFIVSIASVADLDFGAMWMQLVSAFDTAGDVSAGIRAEQFVALMSGWYERPIIGHGAGAAAMGVIRDAEMPWAYELSYVALLFQTGLLGVIIYSSAVLWIFWAGIAIARRQSGAAFVILPLLAGLAGFLLVNATNPYLMKFDYLWTIFLPVAAINVYRTRLRVSTLSSSTGTPVNNSRHA